MGFGEAISTCFKKYVDFSGRARRSEFWYFFLFQVILSVITTVIDAAIGNVAIGAIVSLALLLPSLAVAIRRLHDIGKSGWFILIGIIPIVGWILVIVWEATDSNPGDNQYGPNPKGVGGQGYQGYGTPGGYPPPTGY